MLPRNPAPSSQKLQPPLVAGTRVRVRDDVWRVHQLQPYRSCTVVHLVGIGRDNARQRRIVIHPFDRLTSDDRPGRLRVVRPQRWVHSLKRLLAAGHPHDGFRAAARADIDLLAYQLEPTLAILRGLTCRVLLADEVGLGKTIQAGLLLAELRDRGLAERTLVLAPAGLRRQWQAELQDRFAIRAVVVDRASLRARASELPAEANPWLIDEVAIVSIDLIKRAEAVRGLASVMWDLLVIDEAHLAAPGTQRLATAHTLGLRARRVALLSATPHAGDSEAFAALCRIGAYDEQPPAVFRRTRRQVASAASRRVHSLAVRLTSEEQHVHRLLHSYTGLVMSDATLPGAALAMAVLTKRALSGPVPLQLSIERRIETLSSEDPLLADNAEQLSLPLTADELEDRDDRDLEPSEELAAPGLTDRARELSLLTNLLQAARAAGAGRKISALIRFLRRIDEPAIVFTEYRDTLHHVAHSLPRLLEPVVIHGGLTEAERVLAQRAFTDGPARLLLATDAAGEGLNLQARCRLVINIELPWNPMRLEQRIGRVDRIGQKNRVHVLHFVGRNTAETDVLTRLVRRLGRVRREFADVGDPVGLNPALARAFLQSEDDRHPSDYVATWRPDLRREAAAEVRRLQTVRAWSRRGPESSSGVTEIAVRSPTPLRHAVQKRSIVWVMRACLVDGNGQLVEQRLIALIGPFTGQWPGLALTAATVRPLVRALRDGGLVTLQRRAVAAAQEYASTIEVAHRVRTEALARRETHVIRALEAERSLATPLQPGLFERRTLGPHEGVAEPRARALDAEVERFASIEAARTLEVAPNPELTLVLVVSEAP